MMCRTGFGTGQLKMQTIGSGEIEAKKRTPAHQVGGDEVGP